MEAKKLIAYVDGSYNIKEKRYGFGSILIESNQIIKKLYGQGNNENYVSMRNVAGEIAGAIESVKYAIDHNYQEIEIYYDFIGIEMWATKKWKANKIGTKAYLEVMQNYMKQITVRFIKVKAHTGNTYNEMADELAKKACGNE